MILYLIQARTLRAAVGQLLLYRVHPCDQVIVERLSYESLQQIA